MITDQKWTEVRRDPKETSECIKWLLLGHQGAAWRPLERGSKGPRFSRVALGLLNLGPLMGHFSTRPDSHYKEGLLGVNSALKEQLILTIGTHEYNSQRACYSHSSLLCCMGSLRAAGYLKGSLIMEHNSSCQGRRMQDCAVRQRSRCSRKCAAFIGQRTTTHSHGAKEWSVCIQQGFHTTLVGIGRSDSWANPPKG